METIINEKPCLVEAKQGFSVSYKNKLLYSKYNPISPIEKSIDNLIIQDGTLVLAFSPVLGYGLDLLISKIQKNSFLFLIENDFSLYDFSLSCTESKIKNFDFNQSHICYKNLQTQNDIYKIFNDKKFLDKIKTCKRVIKINLSATFTEQEKFYQDTFNLFSNYIAQFWKNQITLVKLGKLFSKNIFLNLPQIVNSKKIILHSIEKPILVFGAGTSLDTTIIEFNKNKFSIKDFFIICVDSALKPLLEYNIKPDIVIAVESQLANEKAFIGTKNIPFLLVSDLTSRPNINNYHNKNISFIFTEYCNSNFLEAIKNLSLPVHNFNPLGSVGLYAIELAIKIRKDNSPIFFTGLDFAYTTDGTHCKNAPATFAKLINSNRTNSLIKVDSSFKFGTNHFLKEKKKIISDKPLQNYAIQFLENFNHIENLYNLSDISIFDFVNNNKKINQIDTKKYLEITKKYFSTNQNKENIFVEKMPETTKGKIKKYISNEIIELEEIKNYLMNGNIQIENLLAKINQHDYLFIHFPDGYKNATEDISFLKRVRNEIDFFLKILNRSYKLF